MSRERRRPVIHASRSRSTGSSIDDTDSQDDYEQSDSAADEAEGWHGRRDDIDPSESASATAEYTVNHSRTARQPSRQHSVPRQRQPTRYSHPAAVPTPPVGSHGDYLPGMSESDFYGPYQHPPAPPPGSRYPYDTRFAPSTVGPPYAPPSHHNPYGAQMVSWGQANPFQPQPQAHGAYFEGHRHEMMPYQPPGYPVPYNSQGAVVPPNYAPHIGHMVYPPPGPPPTEIAPRGPTPAPVEEKKPDPEFLKMKKELEMMQLERKKAEEAKARAELEQRIRQEEERRIKDRMEAMREANEVAKREIELARVEAEAAARERLEEARKAEDERRRMEAELRAQAAREERERIEAERKAEAQRAAEQAAALEKAERDAREKYLAAKRAEEEAQAEMARQKELIEIETRNKLLAEQKAQEEARAAAELKAAEAAKQLEIERETLRQKAIQEHEEKIAAEKKALAEAEQAAKAAKQQAHDEFVLKEAEKKRKAEEKAAAEEQAKKEAEAERARLLEEGKKAAAEELKKESGDDKDPIKFKDAVGRKYSFPWKLASQWRTMQGLINQAFAHIDSIGPRVMEGQYDLEGPEGELILKEIWDSTVQPGWSITMKMWPADQASPRGRHGAPNIRIPPNIPPGQRQAWVEAQIRNIQAQRAMGGGGGGGGAGPRIPPIVPGAGGGGMWPPGGRPPPGVGAGSAFVSGGVRPGMTPGVEMVRPHKKEGGKHVKRQSGWSGLLFGPTKKSSSKNRKKPS